MTRAFILTGALVGAAIGRALARAARTAVQTSSPLRHVTYRDVLARRGERRRPDSSKVWPMQDRDRSGMYAGRRQT